MLNIVQYREPHRIRYERCKSYHPMALVSFQMHFFIANYVCYRSFFIATHVAVGNSCTRMWYGVSWTRNSFTYEFILLLCGASSLLPYDFRLKIRCVPLCYSFVRKFLNWIGRREKKSYAQRTHRLMSCDGQKIKVGNVFQIGCTEAEKYRLQFGFYETFVVKQNVGVGHFTNRFSRKRN